MQIPLTWPLLLPLRTSYCIPLMLYYPVSRRLVDPRRKTEKEKVDLSNVSFLLHQPILHTSHHNEKTTKRITYRAVGADEATHVLDKTEDGHADLTTEADLFPDIGQGHCLRGRYQHHSVWVECLQMLHDRDILVRCA